MIKRAAWPVWLEWVLPAKWRQRPAPKPEQNDAVLARLHEGDPLYRALMDQMQDELQAALSNALERDLNAEQRAYHCGQAAALVRHVIGIENWAERARAQMGQAKRTA